MKYFNEAFVFTDLVVDQDGTVDQFAHAGALSSDCSHVRKTSQQVDVIEKRLTEA